MLNDVKLIGNLGTTPEVAETSNGTSVCKFSLATTKGRKQPDGSYENVTTWHKVVVYGKRAESCSKFLDKGSQVFISGEISNRSYEDKEGNTKYISEIIAFDVKFLTKPEKRDTMDQEIARKLKAEPKEDDEF